ncbi:MAG: MoxR family ATPase [Gammaproteobacteria bacterium]|nr:MoxR family ATPase [Gammaproteobacteria bacterium]
MKPAEELKQQLNQTIGQVVFGAEALIHGLCLALISGGHVLLEGVPGVGKTLLAKTLATQLGGIFKRIQCTADLMPSDMTGVHVFNEQLRNFELVQGPLFANVVLVDEINRTGPKTQSALLQAMEEGFITIDRESYTLPDNFLVIASQNPHEFEGTYPLPESQLDRFLLRMIISYPAAQHEMQVLQTYDKPGGGHGVTPKSSTSASTGASTSATTATEAVTLIDQARKQVADVHVSDVLYQYVIDIANASRAHQNISLGLSTRGALGLMRCARVQAALRGAEFVTPDDVKSVAPAVMAHRMILTTEATLENTDTQTLVESVFSQVEVPREFSETSHSSAQPADPLSPKL